MQVPDQPIVADRATLRRMRSSEVMVRTWPNPLIPHQFFRVMDQEVPLVVGACGHFYEQDEYEMVRALGCGCSSYLLCWVGVL